MHFAQLPRSAGLAQIHWNFQCRRVKVDEKKLQKKIKKRKKKEEEFPEDIMEH